MSGWAAGCVPEEQLSVAFGGAPRRALVWFRPLGIKCF